MFPWLFPTITPSAPSLSACQVQVTFFSLIDFFFLISQSCWCQRWCVFTKIRREKTTQIALALHGNVQHPICELCDSWDFFHSVMKGKVMEDRYRDVERHTYVFTTRWTGSLYLDSLIYYNTYLVKILNEVSFFRKCSSNTSTTYLRFLKFRTETYSSIKRKL